MEKSVDVVVGVGGVDVDVAVDGGSAAEWEILPHRVFRSSPAIPLWDKRRRRRFPRSLWWRGPSSTPSGENGGGDGGGGGRRRRYDPPFENPDLKEHHRASADSVFGRSSYSTFLGKTTFLVVGVGLDRPVVNVFLVEWKKPRLTVG